jgi:hypothetical protein
MQHFINLGRAENAHIEQYGTEESVLFLLYFLRQLDFHGVKELVYRNKAHFHGCNPETFIMLFHPHLTLLASISFTAVAPVVDTAYLGKRKPDNENAEKKVSERLMENVHMQVELCEIPLFRRSRSRDGSFRNPEE